MKISLIGVLIRLVASVAVFFLFLIFGIIFVSFRLV